MRISKYFMRISTYFMQKILILYLSFGTTISMIEFGIVRKYNTLSMSSYQVYKYFAFSLCEVEKYEIF